MKSSLALLLVLALPLPAHAIRCREWTRLSPTGKRATISQMIQSGLESPNTRRYDINRARTQQCLQRSANSIELDFDGACADSQTAGLQALNNLFKHYAWSCIQ